MAWQYDPLLSKVEWAIGYLGIATVKGRFTKVLADINLDGTEPTDWSFSAIIDVSSLTSGHDAMDDHVRSPDYLDAAEYPTIIFHSKKITGANRRYEMRGDLT